MTCLQLSVSDIKDIRPQNVNIKQQKGKKSEDNKIQVSNERMFDKEHDLPL